MRKLFALVMLSLTAGTLLGGCLNLSLGGGMTTRPQSATVGQQLIDLQRAKDAGIITEADYQRQKARLLAQ